MMVVDAEAPNLTEPEHVSGRPRVLLVLHDLGPIGGSERACTELIRRGSKEFDFTVVSNTLHEPLRALVHWRRVPVTRRPFPLKFLTFYIRAAFQVAQCQADLVHTMGAIVPNRIDLASVHHCHAAFHRKTGRLAPMEAPIPRRLNTTAGRLLAIMAERWSYRASRTRRLAPVSSGVARELADHYRGVPIRVTPNGVDPERFTPAWTGRADFRDVAGVTDKDVVALFVGGDWPLKGLAPAIRGFALAQRQVGCRMLLWVVGSGDQERYRKIGRACGVADQVFFFGRQSQVERFYQSADIFILPSLYETFSLVAFEAAACGLPVIATRVSGIEELVGENEAGILVDRTPSAIGDALGRLAVDSTTRIRMGMMGRRRANAYTWQQSTEAVLEIYRELLAEKQRMTPVNRQAFGGARQRGTRW